MEQETSTKEEEGPARCKLPTGTCPSSSSCKGTHQATASQPNMSRPHRSQQGGSRWEGGPVKAKVEFTFMSCEEKAKQTQTHTLHSVTVVAVLVAAVVAGVWHRLSKVLVGAPASLSAKESFVSLAVGAGVRPYGRATAKGVAGVLARLSAVSLLTRTRKATARGSARPVAATCLPRARIQRAHWNGCCRK